MNKALYPAVDPNPDFAKLEEEVLGFWRETGAFERSVQQRAAGGGNDYVFYDGPPFANGLPHYGHLLTGYVKDAIARYHAMKGRRVERRFGWDCHGLPAEMGAEKELHISGRAAITDYGIGKFNDYCRSSVMRYVADWEYYVTRQGRWVDFKNDYKTMDKNFMESVIWAFSELYKKNYVYESFRVMPYSWAAETPLSNFETRMDNATREREDKAAYVKFKLKARPDELEDCKACYLVAWTTTPWTLPSNLALAVNPQMEYISYLDGDARIIHAASIDLKLSSMVQRGEEGKIPATAKLKGTDLIGRSYEPLFPYFKDTKNAFRVLDGKDAVTEGEGTGIVHMAPGFGEADQKICAENNIEVIVPVDEKGRFTDEIFDLDDLQLKGLNVIADTRLTHEDRVNHINEKDVEKFGLANMRILRWLKKHERLVKDEVIKHNYPHCWRTDTPVIYRAMSSWYVAVTKFRDRAVELNKQINWIPAHVRDGQMGHMLATAPDWSISRNRFWGTPIPIWRSPSGKLIVPGSIAEIEKLSGVKVKDLHRPFIDEVVIKKDGEEYRRVEDVFDCWFESGSMPYAQLHYPFENKKQFEENFPADFITEYVGQTRGWFNTLIMLSTALFDKPPFKNCICHGVVIDEESGQKYSKRLQNYKDPKEVMDAYGADALRWLMLSSPVMRGMDLAVDPDGKFIRDVVRLNIKPLWSAYNFFTLYANADGVKAKEITKPENLLDRYILAKAKAAVEQVKASMDAYDTPGATEAITQFFDVLNNWYIRRSRARFWAEKVDADKQAAYDTLYTVITLLCRAAAPLLPFTAEMIYRGLTGAKDSVHLTDFPDVSEIDAESDEIQLITDRMDAVRHICTAALAFRNAANIRVRQPLRSVTIYSEYNFAGDAERTFGEIIANEVNVKQITFSKRIDEVAIRKLDVNARTVGKRLGAKIKQIIPASKKGEWKLLEKDKRGNPKRVEVAGEELVNTFRTMENGEVEYEFNIILEPKDKNVSAALPSGVGLVVLDTTITPELEIEGRARDLVRMIQQARKDAGLNVSDRIKLAVDVPAEFKPALATHGDYIKEQTLAVSLGEGSAGAEQKMTQELDGARFVIGISKAA